MLLPFSIPEQVPLIISGKKGQTTRRPGRYKVGDTLHCWFKPRQKKTCGNCIKSGSTDCKLYYHDAQLGLKVVVCSEHRNFFGEAKVTNILHVGTIHFEYNDAHAPYESYASETGERWINAFNKQNESFLEAWARADGFANFAKADKWFKKSTEDDKWMFRPWDVVIFEPEWIIPTIEEISKASGIPIWKPEEK